MDDRRDRPFPADDRSSPAECDRRRQAKAVTFTVADAAALPFPDATFDLVVSTISQHHWSDPGAGLRELNRVLRPEAQAWIYDFRLALRRAQTAARTASPPPLMSRQSPLEGTSQFNPIGRLVLQTAPLPLADEPSQRPDTPSR